MIEEIFKNKKVDVQRLLKYGFVFDGKKYCFQTPILQGEFQLFVFVDGAGKVSTKLIDQKTREEFVLHLTKSAVGAFVGQVREEVAKVLQDVCDCCFQDDVFKSKQAREIIDFVRKTYGDELEFLWKNLPTTAIWRRKDSQKWYGLLTTISKRKLGFDCDDEIEIIDLHTTPVEIEQMVDGKSVLYGYHMNKTHWATICLDGSVAISQILKWLERSYALAQKTSSKTKS